MTLVFSDVVGSTGTGEGKDPETIRAIMDRYFAEMRHVLEGHGGYVEKFVDDAVMAAFGIPVVHEDDALRAVRAAAGMQEALARLNEELVRDWGVTITTRTGVNTGHVVAGDVATRETFATGDTVNTAARLEQAAGAGEILIGGPTYRLVRDAVEVEQIAPLALKGKSDPLLAYRLVSVKPEMPGLARRMDAPLVGRREELAKLEEAFNRSVAERACVVVVVIGFPGVGKSRVVSELVRSVGDNATLLQGRCLSYGEGITFFPIVEVLRGAAGVGESDGPQEVHEKLSLLVRDEENASWISDRLASILGLGGVASSIEEIFWAARKALESAARDGPLVVVIEDLHWAEAPLLELISHVAEKSTDVPLLLICTARPEFEELLPDWGAGTQATFVPLAPLDADRSGALVEALLGGSNPPPELASAIAEAAGGNPLFVEEMLSMLLEEGTIWMDDGRWVASEELETLRTPPSISALIAARLEQLPLQTRSVGERASVVGTEFDATHLAALSHEREHRGLPDHLAYLSSREFIGRVGVEDAYRFRHVLVRDEFYAGMAKMLRAELHERFGSWLEENMGERISEVEEIVGHHLERAVLLLTELRPEDDHTRLLAQRAAERLASSARRAQGRADVRSASNLYSRACSLLPKRDPMRLRLLSELGTCQRLLGEPGRAEAVMREATELAGEIADQGTAARARIGLIDFKTHSDPAYSLAQGIAELEQVVRVLETVGHEEGLASAWEAIGSLRLWLGQAELGTEAYERSVAHARHAGTQWLAAQALRFTTSALVWGPCPVREGIPRCEAIIEQVGGGYPRGALAALLAMNGETEEAEAVLARYRREVEDLGQVALGASAHFDAEVLLARGSLADTETMLSRGVATLQRLGETANLSTTAGYLANVLYQLGGYEDADSTAQLTREFAAPDDIASQVMWRCARAKVLGQRGACDEAEALAREAVTLVSGTDFLPLHASTMMDLAETLRLCAKPQLAADAVRDALSLFGRKGHVVGEALARQVLLEIELGTS